MSKVLLWVVESEYDANAVEHLAGLLVGSNSNKLQITTNGKQAFQRVRRRPGGLEKAVAIELKRFNFVVFIYDRDSLQEWRERKQQSRHFVSSVEQLIDNPNYGDKVFVHMAIEELEAWLLTDCLGIACYYLRNTYKKDARARISQNRKLVKIVEKYQKPDTQLIQGERRGQGPKEDLIDFSQKLLISLGTRKEKLKDMHNTARSKALRLPNISFYRQKRSNGIDRLRNLGPGFDPGRRVEQPPISLRVEFF